MTGATFRTVEGALDDAIRFFKKPGVTMPANGWVARDEPNWRDPNIVSRAMTSRSLSVTAGFLSAMSLGTGSYQRLFTYRNYVAHRNRDTALKVRRLAHDAGISATADPHELPYFRLPGRPQYLLGDWLDELEAIARTVPT